MAAILVILFVRIAHSQTNQNIEVAKLKDNYYKLTSKSLYEVNFLVYVTPEGVLMVDSGQKETSSEITAFSTWKSRLFCLHYHHENLLTRSPSANCQCG